MSPGCPRPWINLKGTEPGKGSRIRNWTHCGLCLSEFKNRGDEAMVITYAPAPWIPLGSPGREPMGRGRVGRGGWRGVLC